MLPILRTARLVLLPQDPAAVAALLAGLDPGLPLGEGYPPAGTLDGLRAGHQHGGPGGRAAAPAWFVTLAEDGRVIGDLGTKGWVDRLGQVEIGYGLAGPFRGRGLGAEAVRALVGWLVEHPDVAAVTAEVEVGNDASRRLLERLGFVAEGAPRHGAWWLVRAA